MGLGLASGSKRDFVMGERIVVRPTLTDQPCLDRSVCLGRALYDLGSTMSGPTLEGWQSG